MGLSLLQGYFPGLLMVFRVIRKGSIISSATELVCRLFFILAPARAPLGGCKKMNNEFQTGCELVINHS